MLEIYSIKQHSETARLGTVRLGEYAQVPLLMRGARRLREWERYNNYPRSTGELEAAVDLNSDLSVDGFRLGNRFSVGVPRDSFGLLHTHPVPKPHSGPDVSFFWEKPLVVSAVIDTQNFLDVLVKTEQYNPKRTRQLRHLLQLRAAWSHPGEFILEYYKELWFAFTGNQVNFNPEVGYRHLRVLLKGTGISLFRGDLESDRITRYG